ncbi:MAG: hypothetical protein A2864_00665 [Candidatus Woykebacteria bacterium RIFCSPHIGHO2_01_FULL_39_12]|uniref:Phosphoribose diphosphate--decaprenyl-phosphate phosphoribosyltransferase n=1 Tax=Candidatus Woykebacteria bacterium RIFCSPHIGHO2_01_FULL_39_12 TaxID=1802599 RepID=A0A1G1WJX7_9BACT|nr:MAG: hypothetical protein A2864_00665 [Candidatus Woykebacteria bacterium RIFCSPHIGHO2_01_FULL_39_12]
MEQLILPLIISIRPIQWLKNLAVFAAIAFSGELFLTDKFISVLYTFLIFTLISSGVYLINDLLDIKGDRLHYSKKNRPLAAGKLDRSIATVTSLLLIGTGVFWSFTLSMNLFLLLVLFITVEISYTLFLKQVILIDVIAIAFAFMIRVFAGSIVVLTPLSSWLILTVMMGSLFFAIGKRRSELTLLSNVAPKHRATLSHYPPQLLDGITFMMATAALITYSLFTFNQPELSVNRKLIIEALPITLSSPKWLMITIPIVVYALFRYLYIIYEKKKGDAPAEVLISDKPLLTTTIIWLLAVISLVYILPG